MMKNEKIVSVIYCLSGLNPSRDSLHKGEVRFGFNKRMLGGKYGKTVEM
jgi:hypothetical protein